MARFSKEKAEAKWIAKQKLSHNVKKCKVNLEKFDIRVKEVFVKLVNLPANKRKKNWSQNKRVIHKVKKCDIKIKKIEIRMKESYVKLINLPPSSRTTPK